MKTDLNELFSQEEGLIGSQCDNCGEQFFPSAKACANCSSEKMSPAILGKSGTLWSWTLQNFMPKPPYNSDETKDTFIPYGVGLVEMPNGIKIKSRLRVGSTGFSIGQSMNFAIVPFRKQNGKTISIFEFFAGDE